MNNVAGKTVIVLSILVWMAPVSRAAPWDVSVDMQFAETGVRYSVDAGLPLIEKLMGIPRRDEEQVREEEVEAMGEAVAAQLESLLKFSLNGEPVAPRLVRFGIAGEKNAAGAYPAGKAVARLEIEHDSTDPLRAVEFTWGLLPERYFASDAVNDLVEFLEPRDRSALIRLRIGKGEPSEEEMREGQTEFAWEWSGEDLSVPERVDASALTVDEGAARGRLYLVAVLGILLILRVALKNFVWRPGPR